MRVRTFISPIKKVPTLILALDLLPIQRFNEVRGGGATLLSTGPSEEEKSEIVWLFKSLTCINNHDECVCTYMNDE